MSMSSRHWGEVLVAHSEDGLLIRSVGDGGYFEFLNCFKTNDIGHSWVKVP